MRNNGSGVRWLFASIVFVLGVWVLVLAFAFSAGAQQVQQAEHEAGRCWPYSDVVEELATKYGERVVGLGLTDETPPRALQVFASRNGGWTMIVVSSAGVACTVASGTDWEIISGPREPGLRDGRGA